MGVIFPRSSARQGVQELPRLLWNRDWLMNTPRLPCGLLMALTVSSALVTWEIFLMLFIRTRISRDEAMLLSLIIELSLRVY